MAFHPYLFFGGDAAAAFTRYQEVFGGELTLLRMADVPGDTPPGQEDVVIHAALVVSDDLYLMGSDDPTTERFGPVQGMRCSYDAADEVDARRVFDALAEGGEVTQALEPSFFSVAFGMCTDRFGTPWMVVGPQPEGQPG
jgi:PhnB protein